MERQRNLQLGLGLPPHKSSLADCADRDWILCSFCAYLMLSATVLVYCITLMASFWLPLAQTAMSFVLFVSVVASSVAVLLGTQPRLLLEPDPRERKGRILARGASIFALALTGVAYTWNLPVPSFGAPTNEFVARLVAPFVPFFFARYLVRLWVDQSDQRRLARIISIGAWGMMIFQVVAVGVWVLTFVMGLTLTPSDVHSGPNTPARAYIVVAILFLPVLSIPIQAMCGILLSAGLLRYAKRLMPCLARTRGGTPVATETFQRPRCRQIEQMRAENPEVWEQIDEFLDHGSSLEECLDDLVYPRGFCHKCGYNLFGNISGICPECGDSAEPTRSERSLRSCQILSRLRTGNRILWKQIEKREKLERKALKERTDMEKARKRRERREQALQSYVEWVRQRERADA